MANILKLIATVGVDGRGFRSGLKELGSIAGGWATHLKGMLAGAFSAAAAEEAARHTIEFARRMQDAAEATGHTAERMQEYDYAARQSGTSVEALMRAEKELARQRAVALAEPNSEEARTFKLFGFDKKKLGGITDASDLLRQFSAVIQKTNIDLNSLPLILSLIGKKNQEVLPALKYGLIEAAQEAHRLGLIMSDPTIEALDKMGDAIEILKQRILSSLGPVIVWLGGLVMELVGGLRMVGAASEAFGKGAWKELKEMFSQGENYKRNPFAESWKAAMDAAMANVMQQNHEADVLTEARERKKKARGISTQELIDTLRNPKHLGRADFAEIAGKRSGFAEIGGFSKGFLNAFDPRVVVEESQLIELQKLNEQTSEIKHAVTRGGETGNAFLR